MGLEHFYNKSSAMVHVSYSKYAVLNLKYLSPDQWIFNFLQSMLTSQSFIFLREKLFR